MNEEPKSVWRRSWKGPLGLFLWVISLTVVISIIALAFLILDDGMSFGKAIKIPFIVGLVISCITMVVVVAVALVRSFYSWRNLRRLFFVLVCLATLVALFYAVEDWRGYHAWKKFQAEAVKQGERFDLAGIIPPPVPDAENFAMAPIFEGVRNEMDAEWPRAHTGPGGPTNVNRFTLNPYRTNGSSSNLRMPTWMKAEKTDLRAWQRYYRDPTWNGERDQTKEIAMRHAFAARYGLRPPSDSADTQATAAIINEFPTTPNLQSPATDVLFALSKFDPLVEELREASHRRYSRFPLKYEEGAATLLPHLGRLKGATQLLALRAAAELETGQTDRALADVDLAFHLVDCIGDEPFLISHLVRIAQVQIALQPVWEGLAGHKWNEAQLAALDADLTKLDFLADYHLAMRGERVCSIGAVDYVRRTHDMSIFDGSGEAGPDWLEQTFGKLLFRLGPGGWLDQDKVRLGRMHLLNLSAVNREARTVSPDAVRRLDDVALKDLSRPTPYNVLLRMFLPGLAKAAEKFARAQTCTDLARVAGALERHRLAHGQCPQTLDELTPRFLAKLPHDVINGQPLKYRRTDDGQFVLYSVGWNGTDDGGKVGLTKQNEASGKIRGELGLSITDGDWVWQYPAK
jgi:hypothetical protein